MRLEVVKNRTIERRKMGEEGIKPTNFHAIMWNISCLFDSILYINWSDERWLHRPNPWPDLTGIVASSSPPQKQLVILCVQILVARSAIDCLGGVYRVLCRLVCEVTWVWCSEWIPRTHSLSWVLFLRVQGYRNVFIDFEWHFLESHSLPTVLRAMHDADFYRRGRMVLISPAVPTNISSVYNMNKIVNLWVLQLWRCWSKLILVLLSINLISIFQELLQNFRQDRGSLFAKTFFTCKGMWYTD